MPAVQVQARPHGGGGVPTTQTSFLQLLLLSSLVGAVRAARRDAVGFIRSRTLASHLPSSTRSVRSATGS